MRIDISGLPSATDPSAADEARPSSSSAAGHAPSGLQPLRRPAPAATGGSAAPPPRNNALPGERQPVTAAKISAALAALAAANGLRSIVSIGRDVGLDRGVANKHIAPDGQCRNLAALRGYPDYPQHAPAIDTSLRALGHAAQADKLAAMVRAGKRHDAAPSRPAAAKPNHIDAHKLVQALQYFRQREAARAAGRFDDETLLRSVDEVVGVKSHMVSGWVTTAGELAKPLEAIARLPGYLERREEIRELLVAFGHTGMAAALLDYVPARQLPSAAALARGLEAMAQAGEAMGTRKRGALRAAELASGLSRTTLNSHLQGDDAALAKKIGSLPDYGAHANAIRASLQRMGREGLANALPATSAQGADPRKNSSPVPWPAHVFLERAGGNLHKIEAAARLIRAGVPIPEATKQAKAHKALILPLLHDKGALRSPSEVADMLDGMDAQAERRVRELVDRLSRRLDPQPAPSRAVRGAEPMRSVMLNSGVFGRPRLLVVDRRTQVPEKDKNKGIYDQNPGLVQPPRSFEPDRHRQPLRWLSTVLKEAFDNSLEVQCYWDAARRQIILSTNRTFLNKQIEDFVRSGKLAAMLAVRPPKLAAPQADRVERHFAKLAGRLNPAADPHFDSASDAVLAAIAEGRIRVADKGHREEGKRMSLHAERRILQHVEARLGEPLQLSNLAGTMRPCGDCAEALDAGPNVRRGPFFTSQAARMLTESDETRARNERDGIGTFITSTRDDPPRLTFAHDTDSDSDARFSDASDSDSRDVRAWLKEATGIYKRSRTWKPEDDVGIKRSRTEPAAGTSNAPPADFDWSKHLRDLGAGEPPPGMVAPHAHHIVFQNGRGSRMGAYLDESKAILAKHGIDDVYGRENLVWAPNKNHSTAAARAVRDALVEADRTGSRDAVVQALATLGRHFADRTIDTLYK